MFKRRVQSIGSTFIISLPKEWVRLQKISKHDEVYIEILPDFSLKVISPRKIVEFTNSAQLELTGNIKYDVMSIVSRYLVGYNDFYIKNTKGEDYIRQLIEELRSNIMGLETLEYDENHLIIRNIADETSISISKIIEKILGSVISILQELLSFIGGNKTSKGDLDRIIEKDKLVDRLTIYSLRILNKILLGEYLPQRYNLYSFLEVNLIYNIIRNLERTVDHLIYIVEGIKETPFTIDEIAKSLIVKHIEKLVEFAKMIKEIIISQKSNLIVNALEKYREIDAFESEYFTLLSREPTIYLVLDNLKRVKAYLHDNIEIVMDLNAAKTLEQEIK